MKMVINWITNEVTNLKGEIEPELRAKIEDGSVDVVDGGKKAVIDPDTNVMSFEELDAYEPDEEEQR